ncbi:MAG: hypothetical protein ABGX20_18885 [Bacillus sp. (in: firmicutes)]
MGLIKNIVTFGAAARVEKRVNEFKIIYDEYEVLYKRMEKVEREINETLEKLIQTKVSSVKSLNKIKKISKNMTPTERNLNYENINSGIRAFNFNRINNTLSTANAVINTAGGMAAGIGTAVGTWALVSTLGISSTGTMIFTLSGAAATNATLAALGGGALAAGGGGMVAGVTVLGGLLVVPALVVSGILSHKAANKKINELDDKTIELEEAIAKIKESLPNLESIQKNSIEPAKELIYQLETMQKKFKLEFKRVYKRIYKIPLGSRIIKWIRAKVFKKSYFSERDLENINTIGKIAEEFAILIDTKVI